MKAKYDKQVNELYKEVAKLTTQVSWLKKNLALKWNREELLKLLDLKSREIPVSIQADLLGLNRSSLYYKPVPQSYASNLVTDEIIVDVFLQ